MTSLKPKVLNLYKNMLKQSTRLPSKTERQQTQTKIRTQFKQNKSIENETQIQKLIKRGEDRLDYLKMITPSTQNDFKKKSSDDPTRYVKVIEGDRKTGDSRDRPWLFFNDSRIDPEDWERHQRLLRRQHFQDRHLPLRYDD